MKKRNHHDYEDRKDSEKEYQKKTKADQRICRTLVIFLSQYDWFPLNYYSYTMFTQIDSFIDKSEDNVSKESLNE